MSITDKNGNIAAKWLKLISVSSIIAVIVMIVSVCAMFYINSSNCLTSQKPIQAIHMATYDSIMSEIAILDSIPDDKKFSPALMRKVLANQKYLIEQQKELILDMRQETGNNIDKMSMWQSFWVALIALFGVCTPALAEYRFRIANEREIREINERVSNRLKELESSQENCDKATSEAAVKLSEIKLHNLINNLSLSWENNLIDKIPVGTKVLRSIIHDLRDNLWMVSANSNYAKNPKKLGEVLLPVLLQTYDFLCRESNVIHKIAPARLINQTKDSIRKAIHLSFGLTSDDLPELQKVLKEILNDLKLIFEE